MRNILLVEDDRVAREALSYLLRSLGHHVEPAKTAEEAKAVLFNFTPDVALLDVCLPGLRGDAFAVYLKHRVPSAKVVFVTAEEHVDNLERLGPDVELIPKPLDFSRLLTSIAA